MPETRSLIPRRFGRRAAATFLMLGLVGGLLVIPTAPALAVTCGKTADDFTSADYYLKGQGYVGCDGHVGSIAITVVLQKCKSDLGSQCNSGTTFKDTTYRNSNSCPNSPDHCQATATGPLCSPLPLNYLWKARVVFKITIGGKTTTETKYSQYPFTQCKSG